MDENEEYVRAHWERAKSAHKDHGDWLILAGPAGNMLYITRSFTTEPAAWSAAREFTDTRKEQIRQLQREIAYVQLIAKRHDICIGGIVLDAEHGWGRQTISDRTREMDLVRRILSRLESALTELTRGWKGQA